MLYSTCPRENACREINVDNRHAAGVVICPSKVSRGTTVLRSPRVVIARTRQRMYGTHMALIGWRNMLVVMALFVVDR